MKNGFLTTFLGLGLVQHLQIFELSRLEISAYRIEFWLIFLNCAGTLIKD